LNTGDTSHHGDCQLNFPTAAPGGAAHSSGNSVLFNPPQLTGTPDPDTGVDIKWATLNTSGAITGYVQPFAGVSYQNYSLSIVFSIVVPNAGNYVLALQHDDGAFFGISNGVNSGAAPVLQGGTTSQNIWQTRTAIQGYNIVNRGGGVNKSGNWSDTFTVNFP